MNPKIEKLEKEIEKTKTKIAEMQAKLHKLEEQKQSWKYRLCSGGAQFQTDAPAACGFFEITAGSPFGNCFTAGEGGCA